jgi:hypothetical protein
MSSEVSFAFDWIRRRVDERPVQAARIAPGASEVRGGFPSFALVDGRDSRAALDTASGVTIRYPISADVSLCLAARVGLHRHRIHDEAELGRSAMSDVHRWHASRGDGVRPSAVDIDPDRQKPTRRAPLLEAMLPRASLLRGVRRIVVCAGLDISNGYPGDAEIAS